MEIAFLSYGEEEVLIAWQPKKGKVSFFMEIELSEKEEWKTPVILSECSGPW